MNCPPILCPEDSLPEAEQKKTSSIDEENVAEFSSLLIPKEGKEVLLLKELRSICKKGASHILLKGKQKKTEDTILGMTPEILSPFRKIDTFTKSPIAPLPPAEAIELLDCLCSEMLVIQTETSSQTTFVLQSEQFAESSFYGAEITIEEFSTAPKLFNVSIKASDLAVTIIQTHLAGLLSLLEKRDFSFGINRIDTSLLTKTTTAKEREDADLDREKDKERQQ